MPAFPGVGRGPLAQPAPGRGTGVTLEVLPYQETFLVAAIDAALAAQNATVAAESLGLLTVYIGACATTGKRSRSWSARRQARSPCGIGVLPIGKRRNRLSAAINDLVTTLFGPRILPFDPEPARANAVLMAYARSAG